MKLMDKNGRLFGKISVIDVVVVLVVLVMAAALYVKNTSLSHTSTRVTNTPITYQVTAYNVRQYVADAIQEGDLLYDQDYSTGGTLGAIQSINASRNFYTPYAQFTGTVTSIG